LYCPPTNQQSNKVPQAARGFFPGRRITTRPFRHTANPMPVRRLSAFSLRIALRIANKTFLPSRLGVLDGRFAIGFLSVSDFVIRISELIQISDFGFRISDFPPIS